MSLSFLEKQIEHQAGFEMRKVRDPDKNFYAKHILSDDTPTPVLHGLVPQTDIAIERLNTTDLHNPGEFCYRNMAIASGSGNHPKTIFSKRVMMNCPFCNKPQFLYNNEKIYDGPPDPRKGWQRVINLISTKLLKKEFWPWSQQLTGTLTIKGPVTCHFNALHRWTVTKNHIVFFYPQPLK